MSKEEKSKTLFSSGGVFVDIFIGLLIAACIAGIVYRCFIYDPHVSEDVGEAYMVYFEIEDAREEYAKYLESGDTVYDAATGLRLGALAVHDGNPEGNAVSVLESEEGDGEIKVNGVFLSRPGELEQGTLTLDGKFMLTPGQVLEIYTDTVSVRVRIVQITEQITDPVLNDSQDAAPVDMQSE